MRNISAVPVNAPVQETRLNDLFKSFLINRRQFVYKSNGDFSQEYCCLRGVPQGSRLGHLLFILYRSDLPKTVSASELLLYADDTCIFTSAKTYTEVVTLLYICMQKDLGSLSRWFRQKLNGQKTEFILFRKHRCSQARRPSTLATALGLSASTSIAASAGNLTWM